MALGLLRAFREHGIDVPGDISIAGFDDVPEAEYFSPPLTTSARTSPPSDGTASASCSIRSSPDPCTRPLHPRAGDLGRPDQYRIHGVQD
jgi:hypothetical protein